MDTTPLKVSYIEQQILRLIADGKTTKEISSEIDIRHTNATIETYRVRLRNKMNAVSSAHMISIAYKTGWLKV